MKTDPRSRRPSNGKDWPMFWDVTKAEVKALMAEGTWTRDPDNCDPYLCEAYVSERGEFLRVRPTGRGQLYASRQAFMAKLEELRNRPPERYSHVLEGNLPQGPHFAEAVPSLIDELARTLKIPRESLDNSFDSLRLVDDALKKIRPKKRILEIPNLFPGLIAYAGEVMRKASGGEWWINEISETTGPMYEPYVRYGPGGRYMNPWLEIYKSITEPGRVFLTAIVSAELAHAGGSGPVFVTDVNEANEYETTLERVKLRNGQEVYRVGVRRRTQ